MCDPSAPAHASVRPECTSAAHVGLLTSSEQANLSSHLNVTFRNSVLEGSFPQLPVCPSLTSLFFISEAVREANTCLKQRVGFPTDQQLTALHQAPEVWAARCPPAGTLGLGVSRWGGTETAGAEGGRARLRDRHTTDHGKPLQKEGVQME